MYENNQTVPVAMGQLAGIARARKLDITMRENIDEQIKAAEARVAELKSIKERLENSGMLDTRIDDIRQAMAW